MLNTPLLLKSPRYLDVLCISPIAVPTASRVNFKVKGFGMTQSTVRYALSVLHLFCTDLLP